MVVRRTVPIALAHHANQYIITNGYQNREGLDELVGICGSHNGYLKILALHKTYRIPLNLHLSGTLLEALLWQRPDFFAALHELALEGLLELIGSSYGQNIMRFFTHEHNLKQLNEELRLYSDHLMIAPPDVRVFWSPERVWDTEKLAPVLTDPELLNHGYRHVLIDDRLLYPLEGGARSRHAYDRTQEWSFVNFAPYRILHGQGLMALPIANTLRQNIPPRDAACLQKVAELLQWLSTADPQAEGDLIAIYGDDFEKAAGVGMWDPSGPSDYAALLKWLSQSPWVRAVKLSEWAAASRVAGVKRIDTGTFVEMSNHFGAGEGYEKWYFDPQWDVYRAYYSRSEERVKVLSTLGADPPLIELAWKHLLASSWETAWHTSPLWFCANAAAHAEPSPWVRALASHSRHAAVIAEAAFWMRHKDDEAHAYTFDIDNDGEEELILKNDKLFAVVSPQWGGRLVYLFSVDGRQGKMVVGNPCDDWNWMEELNKYMEVPANHPGALTDLGYEHDRYDTVIEIAHGMEVRAELIARETGGTARKTVKVLTLAFGSTEMAVTYQLSREGPPLTVECGLSPDYLHLLRYGCRFLSEFRRPTVWGLGDNGVTVWLRLEDGGSASFDEASIRNFGHGRAIQLKSSSDRFTVWIGARQDGKPSG
jgi:starch synthase